MELRYCLNQGILERISKILGDTSNGLTGSEISYFLQQCNIKDVTPEITKWKRLYSALASVQNFDKCSNKILRFIQIVLNPALNEVRSVTKGLRPEKKRLSTVADNFPYTMSSATAVNLQPISLKFETICGPCVIAKAPPAATTR